MKKVMILPLLVAVAFATDFSTMSTEEMMKMRGHVPVEDRPMFQQEMQKRMQNMSPMERQKYKPLKRKDNTKCVRNKGVRKQPTFSMFDLNNDGAITEKELDQARTIRMNKLAKEGKMLRNAGHAPQFATMDKNNDGIVNQEEFSVHQAQHMKKSAKCVGNCPQARKNTRNPSSFEEIDTDDDGSISKEEFLLHQNQRMNTRNN